MNATLNQIGFKSSEQVKVVSNLNRMTFAEAAAMAAKTRKLLAGCKPEKVVKPRSEYSKKEWRIIGKTSPVSAEEFETFTQSVERARKGEGIAALSTKCGIQRSLIDKAITRGSCGRKLYDKVTQCS